MNKNGNVQKIENGSIVIDVDLEEMTTYDHVGVLMYKMLIDPNATTKECLDRRVAHIYKDRIDLRDERRVEALEFVNLFESIVNKQLKPLVFNDTNYRIGRFFITRQIGIDIVFVTDSFV